jgi:hypothetical protein
VQLPSVGVLCLLLRLSPACCRAAHLQDVTRPAEEQPPLQLPGFAAQLWERALHVGAAALPSWHLTQPLQVGCSRSLAGSMLWGVQGRLELP